MTDDQSIESVLSEFFNCIEPDHIHTSLHILQDQANRARLAELPRGELANRAAMLEDLQHQIGHLYSTGIAEWGSEPWPIPDVVQDALDTLFEMWSVMTEVPDDDHSAESSVPPAGPTVRRRNGRGRSRP